MNKQIVVIGFPKCGTTALMNAFDSDNEVEVLRSPSGGLEIPWPQIHENEQINIKSNRIICHKYVAYIYNAEALEYLANSNPECIITLLIRNPLKSLISWHKMHQRIALSSQHIDHFAYREREFYSGCSVNDYYNKFAKNRLNYYKYLKNALRIVSPDRFVVINQENLSSNINLILDYLKKFAFGIKLNPNLSTEKSHNGYADKFNDYHVIDSKIVNDLEKNYTDVIQIVNSCVKNKIWI